MAVLAECTLNNILLGDGHCSATTPAVLVLFDNDGDGYSGNGLMGRLASLSVQRGLNPDTGEIQEASAQFNLRNHDGRYSPRYSTSEYYPNIMPRLPVKMQRQDSGGTFYGQFSGFLGEPSVDPDPNVLSATFDCYDLVRRLRRTIISTALYTDYRSDQLISAVLTLIGYSGSTSLETGVKTFAYASWRRQSALAIIQEITNSEMGTFFIDRDGVPTFHNRYHRVLTTTAAASFSNTFAGVTYRLPEETIYTEALVTVYPRSVGSSGVLWTWDEMPYFLAAGDTFTFEIEYTDPGGLGLCEGSSVVTPVATTDYLANSLSDGSGTNETANLAVSFTAYGRYATVTLTNNDASEFYITFMQVRGVPITIPNPVTLRASTGAVELSTIAFDQPLETSTSAGQDAADYLINLYQTPRDRVTFQVKPQTSTLKDAMAVLDLNSRVSITQAKLGLSSMGFFIHQINISMGDTAVSQINTYEAAAAPSDLDLIILDDAGQTFSSLLGY